MKILLSQIVVADRQRQDLGDVQDLATSIGNPMYGLLQPVVVSQRPDGLYKLEAGGRRVAAVAMLGWTHIEANIKDQLTPFQSHLIELEENVRRKDLEWQEREKAIAGAHAMLQQERGTSWTVDMTAEFLRIGKRTVFRAMELTKALAAADAGDTKYADINKAEKPAGALMRLDRIKDIEKRKDEARIRTMAMDTGMIQKVGWEIILGDALDWMRKQDDDSQDCIIGNPPYGVDIEDVYVTQKTIYGGDNAADMSALCENIVYEAYRILKPNRWFVVFWPTSLLEDAKGIGESMQERIMKDIEDVLAIDLGVEVPDPFVAAIRERLQRHGFVGYLEQAGFKFQRVPAVWCKTGKFLSSLSNPYAQLNITYETFYIARKGEAKWQTQPTHGLVFHHETVASAERMHALDMPESLWEDVLRLIAQPTETVVEYCSGSGRGGIAAIRLGMHYVGLELDPEKAARSQMLLSENASASVAPSGVIVDDIPFEDEDNGETSEGDKISPDTLARLKALRDVISDS